MPVKMAMKKAAKATTTAKATKKTAAKPSKPEKSPKQQLATALATVEKALNDGYGLDTHEIYKALVKPCLSVPQDERIHVENQGTAMLEELLTTVKQTLAHQLAEKQAYLDSTDGIWANLQ